MAVLSRAPRIWGSDPVFLLAGGPSLLAHDLQSLPADRILAVKHAALLRPDARMLFWAGRRFHVEQRHVLEAHFGELQAKRTIDAGIPAHVIQIARLEPDPQTGVPGLSLDPEQVGGFCASASALNLAFHMGARSIVLLGYDLGGTHWAGDAHPRPNELPGVHLRHLSAFLAMAPVLAAQGVRVINVSNRSRIQCFEKGSLHDFL